MIQKFLRAFPYLRPVNRCNLFNRLLKESKGSLLLLYNARRDLYELHSVKSFNLNGESLQAVIEEDMLNGWLVNDYRANNLIQYGNEVASDRQLINDIMDADEGKGLDLLTTKALKTVELMIGREL